MSSEAGRGPQLSISTRWRMPCPSLPQVPVKNPAPTEEEAQASERTDDEKLPENSKAENFDKKLDHAIEESFPTSDPVSVKITK